jgi:type II secretory pathway pseudopilin PulG
MRKATSLIELVIAIVIMGIAVMSLPMVLTQTQSNNAIALQQEAILSTKAKLGFISSYVWDENSWDENSSVSRVLDTTNSADADDEFDVNTTTDIRRKGHFTSDGRRRLWDVTDSKREPLAETTAAPNEDDIDDFDDHNDTITVSDPTDMDYLFSLNMNPKVSYVSDATDYSNSVIGFTFDETNTKTNPTNIKLISVTATGGDGINIKLSTFASNIGQSTILKREW